jgi:murein DD-endopeptidase MepM/ murein hydrolase activator NlpD
MYKKAILRDGGYQIQIRFGDYEVFYQALDGNALVSEGDYVVPGQMIAGVGNHAADQSSNNYHLHLEIRYSSTGNGDWKGRIANPLLFMDEKLVAELKSKAISSPYNNANFHNGISDPLQQPSPIARGGGALWGD